MTGDIVPFAPSVVGELVSSATTPVNPRVAQLVAPTRTTAILTTPGGDDTMFVGVRDEWRAPQSVDPADVPNLRRQMALLDEALRPADRGPLLARVLTLLSHYRDQNPLPPEVERTIAGDWADDLGEFPSWAIEEACRRWRRDKKKHRLKPLPGDIRHLAEEETQQARTLRLRVSMLLKAAAGQGRARPTPTAGLPGRPGSVQDRITQLARAKQFPGLM
jgi:hypothetical protein